MSVTVDPYRCEVFLRPGDARPEATTLSIVVPVHDERPNLAALVEEVRVEVVDRGLDAELIIVDDGSDDGSDAVLGDLAARHPWLRCVRHETRRGQSAAMFSGIRLARGDFVATLDGDLQNDPADLVRMLQRLRETGVDFVQGYRERREDHAIRKVSSWVGRTTRRLVLGDTIRDTGCSARVMRAAVARALPLHLDGMHRFMPVYARALGAVVVEVPAAHRPRRVGRTKYGIGNRALRGLVDCVALRWTFRRMRVSPLEPAPPRRDHGAPAAVDVRADHSEAGVCRTE